ncbi:superoxide dismutase family protein [Mycobacterium angelicum]|uniref:superoxide dismutase family protein n=1 Tax=Mycobacterium angelicum TaxID=470074 RepID=UPI0035584740
MKRQAAVAVAALTAAVAPLGACTNQQAGEPSTSPSSSGQPGADRTTTQLKSSDGIVIASATIDFTNGYATVSVEAGPNPVLRPGFHGLQIHSVGKCDTDDFDSAGGVYQAPGHTGYPASGELTALQVRNDGSAKLITTSNLFTAADLRENPGTALVIHENADYLGTSPAGESSKRLACGVIAAGTATTTSSTTASTTVTTITVPPPSISTSTSTVTVTSVPAVTSTPTTTPSKAVTTPPSLPPGG